MSSILNWSRAAFSLWSDEASSLTPRFRHLLESMFSFMEHHAFFYGAIDIFNTIAETLWSNSSVYNVELKPYGLN